MGFFDEGQSLPTVAEVRTLYRLGRAYEFLDKRLKTVSANKRIKLLITERNAARVLLNQANTHAEYGNLNLHLRETIPRDEVRKVVHCIAESRKKLHEAAMLIKHLESQVAL